MRTEEHIPVLLESVIRGLNIKSDGSYIDGTFGRGGHALRILGELGPKGRLLGLDRDRQALKNVNFKLKNDKRLDLVHGNFSRIKSYAIERNLLGKVDGVLLDLGVSSPQLDQGERGFSFRFDGPLDMRMDAETGDTAAEWLMRVDEKKLKQVLKEFGEEKFASSIAREIISSRSLMPIKTTKDLVEIICRVKPKSKIKKHPATQSFQAIRIYINEELRELNDALEASLEVLAKNGRLCVISFHSIEDRIVKRFMRNFSREPEQYRGLPNIPKDMLPKLNIISKSLVADKEEVELNPRSRSARLRIAERLS